MLGLKLKSSVLAATIGAVMFAVSGPASAAGLVPVEEAKRRCDLSGTMALTTDYIFRGISFTNEDPAIQGSVDLTCGMFYAGAWASSIANIAGQDTIEIDYYAGITPELGGFSWDFGVIYYTYPGVGNGAEPDYVELKAAVSKTFAEKLSAGVTYYHAFYDGSFGLEESNTVEGTISYALPKVSIFSPSISGLLAWEEQEATAGGGTVDYVYWNVGLSADFHERWTLDVRYWDTDEGLGLGDIDDERVVGTVSASF